MFKSVIEKDMQNLDSYSRGARTRNKTDFGSKFSQVGLGPGQSVHTYLVEELGLTEYSKKANWSDFNI